MKITKTQAAILENAKRTIEVLSRFANFTDFFDNCKNGEQNYLRTAKTCNGAWNSSEKWKTQDAAEWSRMESAYNEAVNEHILSVFAKTESVKALERAGLIVIITEAKHDGGAEKIKIL